MASEDSWNDKCPCGHNRFRHTREDAEDTHCAHPTCGCTAFRRADERPPDVNGPVPWEDVKAKVHAAREALEPPMSSEEEEEAPDDECCGECGSGEAHSYCGPCLKCEPEEPPPPQPERRPPFVATYSVQGHLYEVALSGDASVHAVDGALIIRHHLGPVAGIVSVLPVINERSADGAEADQ